ncbi:hypothetical protein [Flavobacterium sp.]|uniref:hypothetical protein n=1 Tax=Flavobacterium sp. TaxID=239 RepID=UPI0025C5D6EA|nr:hypothetical protein [Flavobacterium sp.]MBA4275610.1 hypothetical protein [Flavobacterium sp.]
MTKIKIIIVLVFLVMGLQHSYSQTYKFKTSGFSVMEKDQKGKWGKWSDLNLVNILVKLDTDKSRIIVNSEIIQLFEIIEYQPLEESETDSVYTFTCKDNNGDDCTLSIITRKKQDNRKQLYINYDNRIIVYNISNYHS